MSGPDVGEIEKMMRWENSEVFPSGSVAVAEMRAPASVWTGNVSSNAASPLASVVTEDVPSQVSPSTNSRGKLEQAGFA